MATVRVSLNNQIATTVSVNNQQQRTIRTVAVNQTGGPPEYLHQLTDVDSSDADDGEILVYDSTLGKYVVRSLDGGQF